MIVIQEKYLTEFGSAWIELDGQLTGSWQIHTADDDEASLYLEVKKERLRMFSKKISTNRWVNEDYIRVLYIHENECN